MPAFEIRKLPPKARANEWNPCSNGCRAAYRGNRVQTDLGRRAASHVMTICDHDFYLCQPCSAEAAKVWAEALEGSTGIEFEEAA